LDLGLDYQQLLKPCEGPECNYLAITQSEIDVLESWELSSQAYSLIMNGATVIGVAASVVLGILILWSQGDTRIGWAVSLTLLIIPITMISDVDNVVAHYPNLLIPSTILSGIGTFVLLGFLYLFPSGRFYPNWAFIPFVISFLVFEMYSAEFNSFITLPEFIEQMGAPVLLSLLALAGGLQILRYRRKSTLLERQQTKWILLGILLIILGFPIWFLAFGDFVPVTAGLQRLLVSMGGWLTNILIILALPLTMAIAITRYRLWDIDLVIRRTLQYSLLTGLLVLVYFGSVLLLQSVVESLTGQQSLFVIVISTLVIAALFNPLRIRVQDFIDRRFYRSKYDAEKVLAQFAATGRDEVDLDQLSEHILAVVEQTISPEHVSLCLVGLEDESVFEMRTRPEGSKYAR
jgi:hypothetical protein